MNKILIAEDEPPIANLVKTALDGPDYRCTWAADGIATADLLERESFDLVLLDIMLMAHCWEYGFILRYPTDKSALTGVSYEPWHYRYVGAEAAREITEGGLCLEEYLAQ